MKTKLLFIALLLLSKSLIAQQPEYNWSFGVGGTGVDVGSAISTDNSGNIITTGYFNGAVDFDPGPELNLLNSNGGNDIFIQKVDPNGNLLWVKTFGSSGDDRGKDIITQGNTIIIVGSYQGSVLFDQNSNTSATSQGSNDGFILQINSDGSFVSVGSIGGTEQDEISGIDIDPLGNILLTGSFEGTVDLDPGNSEVLINSSGNLDVFVLKLGPSGLFIWAKAIGGNDNNSDFGNAIASDELGNAVVVGAFGGTVDFNPGNGENLYTSQGAFDAFILKLNSTGDFIWCNTIGDTQSDDAINVVIDKEDNIFVVGDFMGVVDFDPSQTMLNVGSQGAVDFFLVKYASDGTLIWANGIGGSDYESCDALAIDVNGGIYVTGLFKGTVDFDPSAISTVETVVGLGDIFIAKYNSQNGFLDFIETIGGSGQERGWDIDLDSYGNIFVTGEFQAEVDFDISNGVYNINSNGSGDIFVLKLNNCVVNSALSVLDEITLGAEAENAVYQWLDCATGDVILGADNQVFTAIENGEYAVIVYDGNCSDTSDCVTISSVSLIEDQISNFTISPNPITSFALVEGISNTLANEIELITSTGILVRKYEINGEQFLIDMSDVAAGIYFIKIEGGNPLKIVKQ
jgi:hypothetical protein